MNQKLLVAGIGNLFFGDDGFGIEVVRRLRQRNWPASICIDDFGIRGFDLALALTSGWESAILIDSALHGRAPGALSWIKPDWPSANANVSSFNAHTLHPAAVFSLVQHLGGTTTEVIILGCEPAQTGEADGIGLSAAVENAVNPAVALIEEQIRASLEISESSL
jgi:hydrogenase maturation protease